MHVVSVSPTDCSVLARLGQLFDEEGDESQALHYYTEVEGAAPSAGWVGGVKKNRGSSLLSLPVQSFRHFPCDIGVIAWLGTYNFKKQYFEKAIKYFERATLIQ